MILMFNGAIHSAFTVTYDTVLFGMFNPHFAFFAFHGWFRIITPFSIFNRFFLKIVQNVKRSAKYHRVIKERSMCLSQCCFQVKAKHLYH